MIPIMFIFDPPHIAKKNATAPRKGVPMRSLQRSRTCCFEESEQADCENGGFENCEKTRRLVPKFLVEDLHIWKKSILAAKDGLPIGLPPLGHCGKIYVGRRWSRFALDRQSLRKFNRTRRQRGCLGGFRTWKCHFRWRAEMVL